MRVLGAYGPGRHGAGVMLPTGAKKPAGEAVQPEASVRVVAFENEPAGHGCGVTLPSGQKWPMRHEPAHVAIVWERLSAKKPAAQPNAQPEKLPGDTPVGGAH